MSQKQLKNSVISIEDYMNDPDYLINVDYYINKQLNAALNRVFTTFDIDVYKWYE